MRFAELQDWLIWLETLHAKKIDMGLERMQAIADILDLRRFSKPVIMVGGTNGKGSTVAMLEAIYQQAGYHTAIYTSPHLLRFTERLRINSKEMAESHWVTAMQVIDDARGDTTLSYFEFTVLAGLWLIKQMLDQLDVIILEIGMGGRLDSINIVDADIAVLTTIDYDHMDYLGDNREDIGREKAGIMRQHGLAVCGDPDIPDSIIQTAKELHVDLFCQGQDFFYQTRLANWDWWNQTVRYDHLPNLKLPIQNASTVLQTINLMQRCLAVSEQAIRLALARVELIGRFQTIRQSPCVIIDVAHNPQSIAYLAERIHALSDRNQVIAVMGMLKDKDHYNSLWHMKNCFASWHIATLEGARGGAASQLYDVLQQLNEQNLHQYQNVQDAYRAALAEAGQDGTIVVFGSFLTVAAVLLEEQNP